ncbi:hypothetical protein [Mesorhizobium sp. A623]
MMQTDYAGHTLPVVDPDTGRHPPSANFRGIAGASSFTFAYTSFNQKLPTGSICDNLKAGVTKALWL